MRISVTHSLTLALLAGAGLLASPGQADAFCGFFVAGADARLYNEATQVVLMREGTRTVLSMQNNYQGPASDFAMVVPVPTVLSEDDVKVLPHSIFTRIDQLSSPRLVEYWERDPCERRRYRRRGKKRSSKRKMDTSSSVLKSEPRDYGVTIEAEFTAGEYDIVILSAEDSMGLYDWLRDNRYKIPKGAEKVLRPYVAGGMKFFVAKVDIEKVAFDKSGKTKLSPLRFHYDSEVFNLPVRLGLLNAKGEQDLIVYILARGQRYEVANYKNVTIPTNLRVRKRTRFHFPRFYNSLFAEVMRKNRRAVVTEYAWQALSCDPCPTTPLQANELQSLGADVIGPGSASNGRRRMSSSFVLTRLHTRYSKRSLGEDLIFKTASAIVGGREFVRRGKRIEQGATSSSVNTFQARYIIRHRWTGPVTCKNPRYGIWGGPPGTRLAKRSRASTRPAVATDLGLRKRRKVKLDRYVLQSVPEIGLRWRYKGKRKGKSKPKKK